MTISAHTFIIAVCLSFTIITHGLFIGQVSTRIRWSRGRLPNANRLYSTVQSSTGAKPRRYRSKWTWEAVGEMMRELGLTLVSTKDDFENQSSRASQRKVNYYRNDDITTIHTSRIDALKQLGGNKSQEDLMKSIEAMSVAMMKKHPKGKNISQNKEKSAMRKFQSCLEDIGLKGIEFVELAGYRTMSMAFTTAAEVSRDTLYRAIRVNSAWVEDKNNPHLSSKINYGEIANSLDQGGSLVLVAVDAITGEMLKLWFVYDDSEGSVSRGLRALGKSKTIFKPCFAPKRKEISKGVTFMSRFMYDPTADSLKLAKAFDDWCATSEGHPLDFWNHDRSQIKNPTHRMASASYLSLRDSLPTCTLPETSNDIIFPGGDVVRYLKRNIRSNGQVQIRNEGSPPYNRNDVDVFIFPICEEGGNKEDKSSWTKVCIVSSREAIDLVTRNLRVVRKRKGEKVIDQGEVFDLATDQAAVVAELRRCKAVPQVSEEEIEGDKEEARKYDRELAKRRGTAPDSEDDDEDDEDDDRDVEVEELRVSWASSDLEEESDA